MKGVWVDQNNGADFTKLKREGINIVMFPLTGDLTKIKERINEVKARALHFGVYSAWNWYPTLDGPEFAEKVYHDIRSMGMNNIRVQFDIEEHDPTYVAECLERWRVLQPKANTSWTMEPNQGGWMDSGFVNRVLDCRVRICPQTYLSRMANIDLRDSDPAAFLKELRAFSADSATVQQDLVKRGFPITLISPMYDAAFLPNYWSGYAFTQGRLS